MRKKKSKTYFVALNKDNNDILIATSKTAIADFLSIHPITIARHLELNSKYECTQYIIYKDVPIHKINRRNGFGIR